MTDEQKAALHRAAEEALQVQDAVNLSGILLSWARNQRVLMEVCGGNQTTDFLQHPVNILFMSKVSSLMMVNTDNCGGISVGSGEPDLYARADKECRALLGS